MTRRVAVVLLGPVSWVPPGIDPVAWRHALAEDVVDRVAALNEVQPAIAATPADRTLTEAIAWPGMRTYDIAERTVNSVLAAASADGYDQAVVVAADAPDVPALIIGKLLRPLTSRALVVSPSGRHEAGLFGMAARLPVPTWLPPIDLDTAAVAPLRSAAPRPAEVKQAPLWRRLRHPQDLATLDPAIDGWDNTRALLSA